MRRLLIFLREPIPGTVKTRLAAVLGDRAACEVYRACVELTLERLRVFQDAAVLCVEPPEALARIRAWLGPAWALAPQQGRDLGARLSQATAQAFADGARDVIAIGTDSPWLRPADIEAAFEALARAEVVLGPTQDGGYYLIGLSHPAPPLFEGIAWGSASVCAETRAQAETLGLAVQTLSHGYDVDTLADLERWILEERRRGILPPRLKAIEILSQRRKQPCLS